jgi:hypothetical protein
VTSAAKDQRIEFRMPISCMYEAHGPLMGYQTTEGGICVKPCDLCLAENSRLADERWKADIEAALSA